MSHATYLHRVGAWTLALLVAGGLLCLYAQTSGATYNSGVGRVYHVQGCTHGDANRLNLTVEAPATTVEVCWTLHVVQSYREDDCMVSEINDVADSSGCTDELTEDGTFMIHPAPRKNQLSEIRIEGYDSVGQSIGSQSPIIFVTGGPAWGCPSFCSDIRPDSQLENGASFRVSLIGRPAPTLTRRALGCSASGNNAPTTAFTLAITIVTLLLIRLGRFRRQRS